MYQGMLFGGLVRRNTTNNHGVEAHTGEGGVSRYLVVDKGKGGKGGHAQTIRLLDQCADEIKHPTHRLQQQVPDINLQM